MLFPSYAIGIKEGNSSIDVVVIIWYSVVSPDPVPMRLTEYLTIK